MITLDWLAVTTFKSLREIRIQFPASGAVLIEGANESGKSTLFECIYFGLYGNGLVTEDNRRSLESLIMYGEESARVCLGLRTGDQTLEIERTIRRGKTNTASLTVTAVGTVPERITAVREVNRRIIAELGGLDGAALLNSCFVEQKRLGKLEELGASERRESLLRILNLDKISQLEDQYRVRRADEVAVQQLADQAAAARARHDEAVLRVQVTQFRASLDRRNRELKLGVARRREDELTALTDRIARLERLRHVDTQRAAAPRRADLQERERDVEALLARRPRIIVAGLVGAAAMLLATLGALAAGSPMAAFAAGTLLLGLCAVAIYTLVRTSSRIEAARAASLQLSRAVRQGDLESERLRVELGLPPDADLERALSTANRAQGAAEHELTQLRNDLAASPIAEDGPNPEGQVATVTAETLEAAEERLRELVAQVRHLSTTVRQPEPLADAEHLEREHARALRDLEVRRHAGEILAEARRRMVDRVLPETERNMSMILPLLTAGRYFHARITEDYRIDLWDEAAYRYVGKNVYSGGTKDQISLALRLAFAIASLPQEMGSSPGFLFLDEPLSSFDEERTGALVDLITRGELAAIFPQIFLISHSRSFDPGNFPFVLRMENGGIGYTTLGQDSAQR
jgi:DNA repair exonuclease SbcCD ATPase subunit